MRLIDADELLKYLKEEIVECDELYDELSEHTILGAKEEAELISDKVTEMPEAVIRCKDCKYWNKIGHAMYCTKHISIMYMDTDDFCSRGELK